MCVFFDSNWIPRILKSLWDKEPLLELNKKVDVMVDSRKDKSKRVCANVVRLCCHHLLPLPDCHTLFLWNLWGNVPSESFLSTFHSSEICGYKFIAFKEILSMLVLYKQYSLCLCCSIGFYVKYILKIIIMHFCDGQPVRLLL